MLCGNALVGKEKEQYQNILDLEDDPLLYVDALTFLSMCLVKYHKKNAIILIDEYDVPLENAWFSGFYEDMVDYIRSLNYELDDKYEEVMQWFYGYQFGGRDIYNTWSIINYADTARLDRNAFPRPYWSNTSSNSIIQELVEEADFETRNEIESLIVGDTIEKPVHEDITYGDIHESRDNLWNFLYFTGYLKKTGERPQEESIYLELAIPNAEIRSIYRNTILTWFDKKIQKADLSPWFTAIEMDDCEAFGNFVSDQLLNTISFFDYAEYYCHGFLTGLLKTSQKYRVLSNRDSGTGRPDILMKTPSVRGGAVILELKVAASFQKMEDADLEALAQIEDRNYEVDLRAEGYSNIKKYGICFYQKECLVMSTTYIEQ